MNELQSAFLKMAVPAALETKRLLGVPASITIAQAILESGWGCSALSRKANNYFGIKASDHVAPDSYIELPTHEVVNGHNVEELAKFARYATVTDCFKAHACLLSQSSRYAPAMAERNDPAWFALELRRCGYSTNPLYDQELMHLVDLYDLRQYDVKRQGSGIRDQGSEKEHESESI
jgi:flagellum-specific peptidoglycan hydrolase FlgJ